MIYTTTTLATDGAKVAVLRPTETWMASMTSSNRIVRLVAKPLQSDSCVRPAGNVVQVRVEATTNRRIHQRRFLTARLMLLPSVGSLVRVRVRVRLVQLGRSFGENKTKFTGQRAIIVN